MKILLTPNGLFAVFTILAGICLFGVTPYLPRVFPPAFVRMVGLMAVCFSLLPLWAYSASWQLPTTVGACAFAVVVIIHTAQTRPARRPSDDLPWDGDDIDTSA